MPASPFVKEVDGIQRALKGSLTEHGFKSRGRTFNRQTSDGLTQVVNLQMGSFDPPGTTYIPGLRENLHGMFTVNLGIYIPEVAELHGGGPAKAWVQDYNCAYAAASVLRAEAIETSGGMPETTITLSPRSKACS